MPHAIGFLQPVQKTEALSFSLFLLPFLPLESSSSTLSFCLSKVAVCTLHFICTKILHWQFQCNLDQKRKISYVVLFPGVHLLHLLFSEASKYFGLSSYELSTGDDTIDMSKPQCKKILVHIIINLQNSPIKNTLSLDLNNKTKEMS